MALIVEDGTGLSTAESYISVADAKAYHLKMGNEDAWDAIDNQEAALRKATRYMVQVYRTYWAGERRTTTQALDWPRANVPMLDGPGAGEWMNFYDFTVVPNEIKEACAELALKTADGALLADTERAVQTETVGPISTTYFSSDDQQKRYAAVGSLLTPFMASSQRSALTVSRA